MSAPQAPVRCNEKAGTTCTALSERIGDQYAKGITSLTVFNLGTFQVSWHPIVYKKTPQDKGLLLNYCPWCGGRLNLKAKKRTKAVAR